ncbi:MULTISPECIES: FAD-binding protein [unclassified Streptomyces]|uniref:FAD-binding oxidoreductase n=1 Tax=unclassified Streptomyces TaxID=2593676 RepID=UPI0033B853CD
MNSNPLDRRALLLGTAAVTTAAATGSVALGGTAQATPAHPAAGPVITPDDPRYPALIKGSNQRFLGSPEHIKMIRSAADARAALTLAVRTGKRISVRSGGHCLEDFTYNPKVQVVLDFSEMNHVDYDPRMRAFSVEPGAQLSQVYESLYKGWGVTLPGGVCHSVGAGGHVAGGGYGILSRSLGLVVDHLYAVEVTTVDEHRRVRTVVATREKNDPHRDLWWAHTGGGGGNFGLVTKYWFRSPGAHGTEPGDQLVSPPGKVLVSALHFPWDQIHEGNFVRLLKNYGAWHEANKHPNSPYRDICSLFNVNFKHHGGLSLYTQIDATGPDARKKLDTYLAALREGTGITPVPMTKPSGELAAMPGIFTPSELPWLRAVRMLGASDPTGANPTARIGFKNGYFRKNFTDHQLRTAFAYLSRDDLTNEETALVLFSFGGKINEIGAEATAMPQRDSGFKAMFQCIWSDERDDAHYLAFLRDWYADFYAETKGVPALNGVTDGCYINYPDVDLTDPAINTSGIHWSEIFYKQNYPRLQRIKAAYDPHDVFRHSMSIRPAGR